MHSDQDIEFAAQQLEKFRVDGEAYHKTQADVYEKYAALMEDFKRLKSDYEEERDSRERYKQLAKGQERNPFVLVLVDGDGMVFDDDLVSNGAEGGSLAAQRLNDAVRSSLRTRGLDHCRVMVRIYANLAGLSKAVSKAKLCGADKRALAPFVASFNRSNDLFDFVDAGELKENADFKIRAMFRQFADNAQCKHIYFAACHDVGYISELTPFINNRDRITLVCTYATHREFGKLGLKMEELPHIFRTTPLPSEQQAYQHRPTTNPLAQNPFPPTSNPSIDYGGEKICHFFSKGICKYGRSCKNIHSKPSTNNSNGYQSPSDVRDWRKDSRPPVPTFQNHDFMSGAGQVPDFEALLPKEYDIPTNKIPINKSQQRLDSYMPRTSPEDHAAFLSRVGKNKLCNNHHLKGECIKGDACEYDHNPITDGIRNNLVSVARHMPCPRRNMCRVVGCTHGHICQKTDCKNRGGKASCKLPHAMHSVDPVVADFVPGTHFVTKDTREDENGSANGRSNSRAQHTVESDGDSGIDGALTPHRDREEDTTSD